MKGNSRGLINVRPLNLCTPIVFISPGFGYLLPATKPKPDPSDLDLWQADLKPWCNPSIGRIMNSILARTIKLTKRIAWSNCQFLNL